MRSRVGAYPDRDLTGAPESEHTGPVILRLGTLLLVLIALISPGTHAQVDDSPPGEEQADVPAEEAQDETEQSEEPQDGEEPSEEESGVSDPLEEGSDDAPVEEEQRSLFERTLPQDIATADLQELIIWARALGLSDRGTRREVEDRILEYYGVARAPTDADRESESETTADGNLSILRIDRARGTDYFTLEEVGEDYLRIVGGVVLSLEEEGAFHTIEAEEVVDGG